MKKVFSIFLCLCMLLTVVALFSACQGEPEEPVDPDAGNNVPVPEAPGGVQISEKTVSVDLSEYVLMRPRKLSTTLAQLVVDLGVSFRQLSSLNLRINQDNETSPVQNGMYEVLIGQTQRVETVEALSEIEGDGWVIRVFLDKIVIAGTTDFLTRNALEYFVANFMKESNFEEAVFTLPEKVLVSGVEMMSLVADGTGACSVVYQDGIDDKKGSDFGNEYAGTGFDYHYDVAFDVRKLLTNNTGVLNASIPLKTDAKEVEGSEIQVGTTNRADNSNVLAGLQANQYAVTMKNGNVVIAGWNQATLSKAYNEFHLMVIDSIVYDDENRAGIRIPANMNISGTLTVDDKFSFIVDFPKPEGEGISLLNTTDVGENSMLFVYSGDGVNRESYVAYCEALEAAGYVLYSPETTAEGSSYRTYLNESTGVTLYVSHIAYAHAEEQEVDIFTPSIRIVSSHLDNVDLPDAEILEADRSWTKRTDPMITMLKLRYDTGNFGLSAILTLEDGSFVIYDGGGSGETSEANDENNMYSVLTAIHTKVYGTAPNDKNPLRIRAWIITHEHWDHQMVFYNFCKEYGKDKTVLIDRLIYNPASNEETYNCYNPDSTIEVGMTNGTIKNFLRNKDTFEVIKAHSGQKFYLANAEIEVLYTHEDIHPHELIYFNNSSTILRITMNTTGKAVNQVVGPEHIVNKEVSIWLGDLERVGSSCLRAVYGDTLKADIVQVAHHGYNGCEKELYALIDPEVVLWPTDEASWIGQTKNPNTTSWYLKVDYFIAHELPNVKMIIVSSYYNTTLTLTANGPDYYNLWDAKDNKEIVTDTGDIGTTAGRVIFRPLAGN